jgi:hypothetical protein
LSVRVTEHYYSLAQPPFDDTPTIQAHPKLTDALDTYLHSYPGRHRQPCFLTESALDLLAKQLVAGQLQRRAFLVPASF